jgi:2-oxoglutarate ferredoxin oxidoreductase subunit alpha
MMEGISYIVGSEVPAVLVDIMRGGPGLGNIAPSQGDYIDLTVEAFDLAEKYRNIVTILADGSLGQMMEPAELPPIRPARRFTDRPEWALTGAKGREPNIITSIYLDPPVMEAFNLKLTDKFKEIEAHEVRYKELLLEDAEIAIIAFGTAGRVAQSAINIAREQGIKVGLMRPISLYPYPYDRVREISERVKAVLVVEMSGGQMIEDVRLAVEGRVPISFYGRMGGIVPLPDEVLEEIRKVHSDRVVEA